MNIVDRRLNPHGKNLPNRQRFLRRARAMVREAVREASASLIATPMTSIITRPLSSRSGT